MQNEFSYAVNTTVDLIKTLRNQKDRIFIAIDGMSGSGKSTFAQTLSETTKATLIHCDDFFLRPEQRTEERLSAPGGNLDTERIISEVIQPIIDGDSFAYKPFNCHIMDFDTAKIISPEDIIILEGSYSCHPALFDFFDIHIFLSTDRLTQVSRILLRGGYNKTKEFIEKWIPMENKYFQHYNIKDKCELSFKT
ncbi:MAG: hypothetical protein E7563_05590 [Ruminococcaceae bacterium]|nr:hypothetical protein [Oscillospiraceae bacterium]